MHIIFLRTDSLNKALCQSDTSLFIVVGCGSVVSEIKYYPFLGKKKTRFLIALPGIHLPCIECDRKICKFHIAQNTPGYFVISIRCE